MGINPTKHGPRPNHTNNPTTNPNPKGHNYKLTGLRPKPDSADFGRPVRQESQTRGRIRPHQHDTRLFRHDLTATPLDRHHLETSPELHHRKPRAQKHRKASIETNCSLPRFVFPSESFIDPIESSSDRTKPWTTWNHEPSNTLKAPTGSNTDPNNWDQLKPATQDWESLHPPKTKPTTADLKKRPPPRDKAGGDGAVEASPPGKETSAD